MRTCSVRCSAPPAAVLSVGLGLVAALAPALAQEPASANLQRVVITGSQIPRIDAETALPVQVISREEIERSGALSVEEIVGRISSNVLGTNEAAGVGDFNSPGFSGVSLRRFGEHATLVLLNGRRIANYAFSDEGGVGVDLHAIPLAAIDRIEVLSDGASAIYGSDAVAGVVNFILRRDFRGAQVSVEWAQPQAQGGGARQHETATFGFGDATGDGFNVFAVIDHQRQQALAARDRGFAATAYRPELALDKTVGGSFPANIEGSDRGSFLNPAAPGCTADTVFNHGGCFYDYVRIIDILPQTDNLGLLLRGTLALPNRSEAYAELLSSRQQTHYSVSATPINPFFFSSHPDWVIPPSSPYYPTNLGLTGDIVDPLYRTLPLGPRVDDIASYNVRALLGWRGDVANWDVDTAVMQSTGRSTDRYGAGYVDASRLSAAFSTGLINPFGDSGPQGDALLASTRLAGIGRQGRSTLQSADLRASRDIGRWGGGTATIGLGVEARREKLDDRTTELAALIVGGSFVQPNVGARSAQALYAEMALPIVPTLDAQLALRADHYSDFGNSTSPKMALRWQPSTRLLLRASAGKGFRAPSLPELYSLQLPSVRPTLRPDPKRCPVTQLDQDCFGDVEHVFGGNPALQPETSRQTSFGVQFEPVEGGTIALDWWRLTLNHTITAIDDEVVLDGNDRYEGKNIVRGPVDPLFPNLPGPIVQLLEVNENVGRQTASGVDVNLRLRTRQSSLGGFALQLSGSYIDSAGIALDGVHEEAATDIPRWQHTLTLGWERAPWTATLVQTWRAGYADQNPGVDGLPRRVAPYQAWDAQVGYSGFAHWMLVLGIKNLFDRAPPFSNQTDFFQVGYDPRYADPRGRVLYARAGYRWR